MKSQQPHFHFGVHTTLKTAVHSSWPADFGKRPSEADGTVRDEGSRRARERPAGVRDRRKAVSGRRRPPHAASAALAPLEPRLGAARRPLRSGSLLPSTTRARRVHRVRSRAGGARADMHRRVRSAARGRGQAAELQAHPARPAPGDGLRRRDASRPGRGMDGAAEETGAARRSRRRESARRRARTREGSGRPSKSGTRDRRRWTLVLVIAFVVARIVGKKALTRLCSPRE